MDRLNLVQNKRFLGREFLTWLWFQSEKNLGVFSLKDEKNIELWIDNKIILESDDTENIERVSCHGENTEMYEARQALSQGKKVVQAAFKLSIDENEWRFTLDDCWLNFKTCKTPKIAYDKKEDPEGLFFEKTFLLQEAIRVVEELFLQFVKIRLCPDWPQKHLPFLQEWINHAPDKAKEV